MFLDSILGIPSQIISIVGGLANNIISIPGQLVGTVTNSIGGTIGAVSNVAGQNVQGIANTAGANRSRCRFNCNKPFIESHCYYRCWYCSRDLAKEVGGIFFPYFFLII